MCVLCCLVEVPDATNKQPAVSSLSLSPSIHPTLISSSLSHAPLQSTYLLSSSCLPVSSSLPSSRVCTCAPYCCCSIPRHLGCLVPCIPSAPALTTKLSVYSKTVHAILARVPLLEHRSLSAPPGLTLHTSAARLACRLVHINPRPPQKSCCSSSSLLRRHLEEALTRPLTFLLLLYMQCIAFSV